MTVLQADLEPRGAAQGAAPIPRRRWVPRGYLAEVISYLKFLVPSRSSILEIGCGDGEVLSQLAPARGVGLDPSPALIDAASRKFPELTFGVLDVETSVVTGTFDVIILRHAAEFMPDILPELQRLRPHCHPGTRVILITHNYLWAPVLVLLERLGLKRSKGRYSWLTLNDLSAILSFAEFDVVRREYRTPCPVGIPGFSWLMNRVVGKLPVLWKLGIDQWIVARPLRLSVDTASPIVSVVVPCRNERGTIASLVDRVPEMGRETEIIFVEGHSTDGTMDELLDVQARHADRRLIVLTQSGTGKGDAVRTGVAAATGDVIVILDADLSVPPEVLPRFVDALVRGQGELALGSRLVYPMPSQAMRPLNMIANMLFGRAFSFLIGYQVKDTLCGTKAFWRRDYDRIIGQRGFFGFDDPFGDFDLILGAAKLSLRILEIPVPYQERVYGTTNIRRWRHGLLLLTMSLRALVRMKVR